MPEIKLRFDFWSSLLFLLLVLPVYSLKAGETDRLPENMFDVLHEIVRMEKSILNEIQTLKENQQQCCKKENVHPRSCLDVLRSGHVTSGVYEIYHETGTKAIKVYCDQETDGGGWTVFQRREDGSVGFYRNWADYKAGFGNLEGEFWLGNNNLHLLTAKCCHELRIDMEDFENNRKVAKYDTFTVGAEAEDYVLTAEGFSGDAGDSLTRHNGEPFMTKDHGKNLRCPLTYKGGWWYAAACHLANLNGLYLYGKHKSYADGIEWYHWKGHYYSLKFVEMKFRETV